MNLTSLSSHLPKLKLLIVILLVINILLFAVLDTLLSTLDTLIWVLLLLSYEFEALNIRLPITQKQQLRFRRILILIVPLVFIGYVLDSAWLDVSNSLLWFGLICLLELEIHKPVWVAAHQQLFWQSTMLVFVGLLLMVVLWLWQGAWLDAYDGLLWILAFAIIEVDVFSFMQGKQK
jgi:hypothetical protein